MDLKFCDSSMYSKNIINNDRTESRFFLQSEVALGICSLEQEGKIILCGYLVLEISIPHSHRSSCNARRFR